MSPEEVAEAQQQADFRHACGLNFAGPIELLLRNCRTSPKTKQQLRELLKRQPALIPPLTTF